METIKQTVKQLFSNQYGRIPSPGAAALDFGDAMIAPGSSARPAVVVLPEPVVIAPTPAPVPYCIHCGQALPPTVAATPVPQPVAIAEPVVASRPVNYDDDLRPIDWAEEARDDLPMRSARRIQFLLTKESPEQTTARIFSDQIRYRRGRQ